MALLAGIAALFGAGTAAIAQAYPTKPVMFIIGFAPGGPSDVLSRILCKKFEELLGQPFVIENKAGAGGGIAAAHVARLPNDGYSLMLGARSVLAGNQFVYKQINYDPGEGLRPRQHRWCTAEHSLRASLAADQQPQGIHRLSPRPIRAS